VPHISILLSYMMHDRLTWVWGGLIVCCVMTFLTPG
jgi:hypothetical protein